MRPTKIATYDTFRPDEKPKPKLKVAKGLNKNAKPKSDLQQLVIIADKVFSAYIKRRDADSKGNGQCSTCPQRMPARYLQAGHFVKRGENAVRWNEMNVALQCEECNCYRYGSAPEFAQYIDKRYGNGTADKLIKMGKQPYKLEREVVLNIIEKYKKK